MINCGIDIIEIKRIKNAAKKTPGFLERVFSKEELIYFHKKGERFEVLAGFFAAKEAFFKYLKTGIKRLDLKEISVAHEEGGAPYIMYKGVRQNVALSISHDKEIATAVVCGESEPILMDETSAKMKKIIPRRNSAAHKGDCGRILVIAGSKGMVGAAVLSAYAALRAGSGLVTLATAESERPVASGYRPEIMTKALSDCDGIICKEAIPEIISLANNSDAVVFGPGIGLCNDIFEILSHLLSNYTGTLIIDADGLNALSLNPNILKDKKCKVILTPHPGEMSRLTGLNVSDIQKNREKCAKDFAREFGVCVVLKGDKTVVVDTGGDAYLNTTGNPGMATAGMGDVLSGIIASFVGQGCETFDAAMLGVYIHGLSGDIAKSRIGMHGMIAGDLLKAIPEAIKIIYGE